MGKRYSIVASNHIDGAESFIKTLHPGIPAALVREPNNPYDANAVAIYVDGRKVGFVPKKQNAVLAQFIDQQGRPAEMKDGAPLLATDQAMPDSVAPGKMIDATFVRSLNSGFPMVEV